MINIEYVLIHKREQIDECKSLTDEQQQNIVLAFVKQRT